MPTGGEIVVARLAAEGVRHIFTVPGESFIAILDALYETSSVRTITCRNEAGAAMMAEATGKLTGRTGVAIVTRGPGAANAMAGVYIAHQDASPMVLLIGLPPTQMAGRAAFQAMDIERVFGTISKSATVVSSADEIDSALARAFQTAMDGQPGPVVVGLPEDILFPTVEPALDTAASTIVTDSAPSPIELRAIAAALATAQRPLVIVGGSRWSAEAAQDLATFATTFDLPVVASFRRQDRIDNRHPCYVGHAGLSPDAALVEAMRTCDLVIALGTRLGDITTSNFTLFDAQDEARTIIHVAPNAGDRAMHRPNALRICASAPAAVRTLAKLQPSNTPQRWAAWRATLKAAFLTWNGPPNPADRLHLSDIAARLRRAVPADTILASGAGNYAAFFHRHFDYRSFPSQLAPVSGSMGYGLPAAIAAKLALPDRVVIAVAGDGCFQMTGQELATAVQFNVPVILIIANNGSLGTIRMHQERRFPGRAIATSLINPDFAALARSYGCWATTVETSSAFDTALQTALSLDAPAVIELTIDIEDISPTESLSQVRRLL